MQNPIGHLDEGRAAFRDESRHELRAGPVRHVKRAAVRVENAGRTLDDQPVKIVRPDDIAKSFTEAVEEIEDEVFLDLNFFLRAFELPDAPALALIGDEPADERGDEQPEEKKTHGAEAALLCWALLMEVVLEVFENVFESGEIFRRRLTERLVRRQHRPGLLALLLLRFRLARRAIFFERPALRSGRAIRLNVENLVEPEAGEKFMAALAATNDVEPPLAEFFQA